MKINQDDLRWTAYVLGELSESDRRTIEEALRTDPEARAWVAELQSFTGQLESALKHEPELELDAAKRTAVFDAAARKPRRKIIRFRPLVLVPTLTAIAALFLVVFGLEHQLRQAQPLTNPTGKPWTDESMLPELEDFHEEIDLEEAMPENLVMEPVQLTDEPLELLDVSTVSGPADIKAPEVMGQSYSKADRRQTEELKNEAVSPLIMKGLYAGRSRSGRESKVRGGMGHGKEVAWSAMDMDKIAPCPSVAQPSAEAAPGSCWGPSIEDYAEIQENTFVRVTDQPLSTFSVDVDTASYANVRRYLKSGSLPPRDAVRIEEMINYFDYDYAPPTDGKPFAAHMDRVVCPWEPSHSLLRIGIKGRVIDNDRCPPCNLVFLLDVSGSMSDENKLPLVKRALSALVHKLDGRDTVAIAVYAGAAGVVLPPTSCNQPDTILQALDRLEAGGSTDGGSGIQLAYDLAQKHFNSNAVNRVILCTDGDFNVGITQQGDLFRLISDKAKDGVFLSVLGFGMGNYKDSTLEQLADRGNGNYGYIDTFSEARKMLVDQLTGTLVTIAKDVKIQVEFNPAQIAGYRLIGYENRMLKKEDFNDDKKDAGEIGAGHTVTALYELIPTGTDVNGVPPVDALKYQPETAAKSTSGSAELLTVKIRYKEPNESVSTKLEFPLTAGETLAMQGSPDMQLACAAAGFGMLLRESSIAPRLNYGLVLELAQSGQGADRQGYRRELLELIRNARAISGK